MLRCLRTHDVPVCSLFGANVDGTFASVDVTISMPESTASVSSSASGDITAVSAMVDGVDVGATSTTNLTETILQGISELFATP